MSCNIKTIAEKKKSAGQNEKIFIFAPAFYWRDSSVGAEKQQICDLHVLRASSIPTVGIGIRAHDSLEL